MAIVVTGALRVNFTKSIDCRMLHVCSNWSKCKNTNICKHFTCIHFTINCLLIPSLHDTVVRKCRQGLMTAGHILIKK